ncbi:hypothetical protein AQ505_12155 [Pedobacter sp. PACM 27299]|uniref:hypothetical protein n=1 Tax=Pedobacter sp. PACM 27299 TaxID=1727164 RepID=UPI0007065705|nr:hypothetical protein [Pedobacter sp. PACM 27299]ALL06177.1 hypothetical protein AQ505_12155 [Pedobacter sp. PACM 27299]
MIAAYQRLFQLDVFHTYFQKDICRCLEFNAASETLRLMERFRFLIRRQINGIGFYTNGSQSTEQLLNYIENATGQDAFCFEIRTNDPDFNFFTELPTNWVGQLLYDSSIITVIDDDQVLLSQQLSSHAGTLCMGKVTLRFADILKFSGPAGFANFRIQYQSRATQWQYFVINRSAVSLDDPGISGKEQIDFLGPDQVVTAAGETALLFSSGSSLIPLKEVPIHKFDLINRPASGSSNVRPQVVIKGLPTPTPEWIGKGMDKKKEYISSPMYVYL